MKTCTKECAFKLDGELNVIADATLVSATDPDVKLELPFYGKLSGSIDLADVPGVGPKPELPEIPSTADIQSDVDDDSSTKCQFLGTPCREIGELATAFASGDRDAAVEAIKTKVKELAKKKAVEIAQELKKKALCKRGIGSDCPDKGNAAATTDASAAGAEENEDDGGIKFGIITMGKIDRVDDLGDTLCGLADGDADCPDNLPDMAIENVQATLMMANAEINVAGAFISAARAPSGSAFRAKSPRSAFR